MSQFLSLDKYENRMLNLVATHVARAETRVMLSRRVKHALVVAMGSRTLVLDPERALLFDVLLGAQLLSNRKQSEQSRRRRPFPRTTVGPWVAAGMAELMERFGRVQAVPGFERYTHGKELPVVVWNEVPWRKIREGEFTSGAESVVMPGLEFQHARNDFDAILRELSAGRYPLEEIPGLDMPVARLPLTLSFSDGAGPDFERLTETMQDYRDYQRAVGNCYQRKSEGLLDDQWAPRLRYSGVHLDGTRLARVVAARHAGEMPRIFRQRLADMERMFDPRQHHVMQVVDVHSLHGGSLRSPAYNPDTLALLANVFRELGVDMTILAFADQVVTLPDATRVYVHSPISIKRIDQNWDHACLNRLAYLVLGRLRRVHGQGCAFPPLQFQTALQEFNLAEETAQHSYRSILYVQTRTLQQIAQHYNRPEFFATTARRIDELLEQLHARSSDARLDTEMSTIDEQLNLNAAPGGHVANMSTL